MNKLLMVLSLLTAQMILAAPPSQVLSDLGARGITETGGTPAYAHYIVRLDTNGTVAVSALPSVVKAAAWSRIAYVDPLVGVDSADLVGAPGAPYRTLGYALLNYPYRTNAGIIYFLGPGTYDSITIDPITSPGAQNITLYGYDSARTVVPYLNFYGGSGGAGVNITLSGVQVQSLRQGNNRALNVTLVDRAIVVLATMQYSSICTVSRSPDSYFGSCSGTKVDSMLHSATNIGFNASVPDGWAVAPTNIAQALNELAGRQSIPAGTNQGAMLAWTGTAWTNVAAGTSNQFLQGGAYPVWVNRSIVPGSSTGQVAVWNGAVWTNNTATTNTGWILYGGATPTFAPLGASNVQYGASTVQGAISNLDLGLSAEISRATQAELSIYGIATGAASTSSNLSASVASNTAFRVGSRVGYATNALNATNALIADYAVSADHASYADVAGYSIVASINQIYQLIQPDTQAWVSVSSSNAVLTRVSGPTTNLVFLSSTNLAPSWGIATNEVIRVFNSIYGAFQGNMSFFGINNGGSGTNWSATYSNPSYRWWKRYGTGPDGVYTGVPPATGSVTLTFVTPNPAVTAQALATEDYVKQQQKLYQYGDPNITVTPDNEFIFDGAGTLVHWNVNGRAADVVIPYEVDGIAITNIGEFAFDYDQVTGVNIRSCIVPKSITSVGAYAFSICTNLTTITLPGVKTLGYGAFGGCDKLASLYLPSVLAIDVITDDSMSGVPPTELTSIYYGQNCPTSPVAFGDGVALNITNYVTDSTATGWGATLGGYPVVRLPLFTDSLTLGGVARTTWPVQTAQVYCATAGTSTYAVVSGSAGVVTGAQSNTIATVTSYTPLVGNVTRTGTLGGHDGTVTSDYVTVRQLQDAASIYTTWQFWPMSNSTLVAGAKAMRKISEGAPALGSWTNAIASNNQYTTFCSLPAGLTSLKRGLYQVNVTMRRTSGGGEALAMAAEIYTRATNGVETEITAISGTVAQTLDATDLEYIYTLNVTNDAVMATTDSLEVKLKSSARAGSPLVIISAGYFSSPTPSGQFTLQSDFMAQKAITLTNAAAFLSTNGNAAGLTNFPPILLMTNGNNIGLVNGAGYATQDPSQDTTSTIATPAANGTATVSYAAGVQPRLFIGNTNTLITLDAAGYNTNRISWCALILWAGTNSPIISTNLFGSTGGITFATSPVLPTNGWTTILYRRVFDSTWKGVQIL